MVVSDSVWFGVDHFFERPGTLVVHIFLCTAVEFLTEALVKIRQEMVVDESVYEYLSDTVPLVVDHILVALRVAGCKEMVDKSVSYGIFAVAVSCIVVLEFYLDKTFGFCLGDKQPEFVDFIVNAFVGDSFGWIEIVVYSKRLAFISGFSVESDQ